MNILLRRVKTAFPFVGQRAAGEDDLFDFCSTHNVELVFTPDARAGIYVMFNGQHFIFINSKLSGRRLLHVAFHEIGHYLLHAPTQRRYAAEFFEHHTKRKFHCEAETVAALLLLPLSLIEDLLTAGIHKSEQETAELIGRRLDIFKDYGF